MGQQLIPLSDEDRQVLTQKWKAAVKRMLAFGTATLLILSALILFHSFFLILVILSLSFVTGMPTLLFWYSRGLLSKDLRLGQKQMLTGPVEAQNIDVTRTKDDDGYESDATYRFWIQIAGRKVTLTEDQYYQFKKGDLAEAFVAPHSGNVLGLSREARG
jgi:hypothetical protein